MESLVTRSEFWSGKRVLVTGHTGFKGSWLVLWLHAKGAKIAGYALAPPTEPALWSLLGLSNEIRDEVADVRDLPALTRAFAAFRPEVVFHMAAQSLVRPSYEDPVETYSTNVMGTVHVLEAARRCPEVRVVVNVTSDKCYENRERDRGYRESDAMGGSDPYSGSKGCAELVTAAYRNSFFPADKYREHGVALASARAGNVIGGGDWAQDRLVPDLVRAALDGRPARIRNPDSTRPWQHVLDPLHGYLMLAELLVSRWGEGASWAADAGPHVHEANYLKLDCSKARSQLGWRPKLALPVALDWTVEWYRAYARRADLQVLCREQLRRFEGLAAQ